MSGCALLSTRSKRKLLFVIFAVYLSKASDVKPRTTVKLSHKQGVGNVYPSDFTGKIEVYIPLQAECTLKRSKEHCNY